MTPLRLGRILFPTDFSACAERAFSHAAYLAAAHDAALHVLHVVEGPAKTPLGRLDTLRITPEDIAADLHLPTPPASEGTADRPVPTVEVERRAPRAADAILDYAREADVDLIVMGTHGRRGMDRLTAGSVAEAVVRQSPVSRHRPAASSSDTAHLPRWIAGIALS